MKRTINRTLYTGITVLLLAGLFAWPKPALAGVSEWSAETIPSTLGNLLGPAGIDIRDYVVGNDTQTIYAVPGDSITSNFTYKSVNAGATWTTIATTFRADLVAVAPDDNNYVVIANNSTKELFLSTDGGNIWNSMGTPPGAAAIRDIAISPLLAGKHYITVAGKKAPNTADLWYYTYWNASPTWQEAANNPGDGFVAQSEVAAIAFSPNFGVDGALLAVTDNISSNVTLQVFDFSALTWNSGAIYPGFPCTVVTANIISVLSASIALSPTYDSTDATHRDLYIGLALEGDTTNSGIYRFRDTVETSILTGKQIHSLALNGSYLIAGSYDDRAFYRVSGPLGTTPAVTAINSYKNPGGDNRVLVAFIGSNIAAGTSGGESAFSISKDSGATFTDISLIDTALTNASDVAVSADGSKVYLVTDDGADTSLWYRISGTWTRVFSLPGVADCIVRTEKPSATNIYLMKKGGTAIFYNGINGAAQWQIKTCNVNIQDMAVESTNVVYAINNLGKVTKSTNSGLSWSLLSDTSLSSGNMLYSIGANQLLAASQDGFIAYTLDGAVTWTKISQAFDAGVVNYMQVVADQNFATNNIIYSASQTAGLDIKKWQIGTSTAWTSIRSVFAGGIYGLAIDSNTLYALEDNGIQSTLWRFMNPTNANATSPDWVGIGVTPASDPTFSLKNEPQAIKASSGKLWAVKTDVINKLYSFTDSVTGITITLSQPLNGKKLDINSISGLAYDVTLIWARPSVASQYEIWLAMDPDFTTVPAIISVSSTLDPVSVTIGPTQTGNNSINFWSGATYYWKLRTTQPGYSVFSETRYFTVNPIAVLPSSTIQLNSPATGAVITENTPSFSWQPLQQAEEYEFVLSASPAMSQPLLDAKVNTTGIHVLRKLEGGKTYFWQVRATLPIISDWSPLGTFMVAQEPPSPVTTQPVVTNPTFTVKLPAATKTELVLPPAVNKSNQSVPGYLVVAMLTALALTGLVLYLIFKRTGIRATEGRGAVKRPVTTARPSSSPKEKPVTLKIAGLPVTPAKKPLSPPEKPNVKPRFPRSKDAATVIFAAKSFIWIAGAEEGTTPDKERESLGKKLAAKIYELAKKEPIYIRYADDAALLLNLWARYGSREETSKYLAGSFKDRPENAVRLIKCFLPQGIPAANIDAGEMFSQDTYKALAAVVDTDKVYAALTASSKFKIKTDTEAVRVSPADSYLISRFIHLHLQEKKKA